MDRKITFAILSLLSALALGGCNPALKPNSLRVQLSNEPVSLDPTLALDGVSLQVLNNIDEGLMGYSGDGQLEKRLAESYQVSNQGRKYTFILKNKIYWSDGQPITVQDFVTAFRRTLGPKTISYLAPLFYGIKNAKAFHEGQKSEKELGVREESGKLVLELEQNIPGFIQSLTLPPTFPLRKEILDAKSGSWPETAPSSGPYFIASHQFEQSIVLEKNPYYRDSAIPLTRVEYKITDDSTALNLFDQQRLDIVTRISALDLPRLQRQGKVKISPYLATYYLSFNCRKPPFNNKIYRQAIAGAIQRNEVVQALGGTEPPAWSWIPKGLEGYLPYKDPSQVFAAAVREVAANEGASRKELNWSIEASYDQSAKNTRIMEKVQQDLLKNLHLKINLTPLTWQAYNRSLHSDPPPLFRYGWVAPFLDPIVHLKVFTTGNLNNFSGFSNLSYDSLVQEIETLAPGPQRENKIKAAQKILLEDEAALVPLYHYVQQTAVSPRVKAFKINPFGVIQFKDLAFE